LKHWMHRCERHYVVFQWENMNSTRVFDTWKSTANPEGFAFGVGE
jgi:hypothetical protein